MSKLNSFPNANIRLFQTESLQMTISNLMKMAESSPKRVENTVGKGEIAYYEQFLLFPVFAKDLYCRYVKTKACLGTG